MRTTNAYTACTIDHDGNLANGLQIGPGVHVAGDVTYGERSLVGVGVAPPPMFPMESPWPAYPPACCDYKA